MTYAAHIGQAAAHLHAALESIRAAKNSSTGLLFHCAQLMIIPCAELHSQCHELTVALAEDAQSAQGAK